MAVAELPEVAELPVGAGIRKKYCSVITLGVGAKSVDLAIFQAGMKGKKPIIIRKARPHTEDLKFKVDCLVVCEVVSGELLVCPDGVTGTKPRVNVREKDFCVFLAGPAPKTQTVITKLQAGLDMAVHAWKIPLSSLDQSILSELGIAITAASAPPKTSGTRKKSASSTKSASSKAPRVRKTRAA